MNKKKYLKKNTKKNKKFYLEITLIKSIIKNANNSLIN